MIRLLVVVAKLVLLLIVILYLQHTERCGVFAFIYFPNARRSYKAHQYYNIMSVYKKMLGEIVSIAFYGSSVILFVSATLSLLAC